MTIQEIESIVLFVARYGFEAVIAGIVVFLLIKHFLPGYLSEKGKNLASKQDIEEITTKIEEVKLQYQRLIEDFKATHQLRLAAIDRRLEVHQEAYGFWREINGSMGTDNLDKIIAKCDAWWSKNSLYLEPEPREAFLNAWVTAKDFEFYKSCSDSELLSECYKTIQAAGNAITKAVELPELNELTNEKKA